MSPSAIVGTLPRARKRFHVGLAVLIAAIAFVGFWPTYFGPLFAGTVDKIAFIHFHAAVYVGWLALFGAQAALAAAGRTREHMKLGKIGIGYGVLVLVVGVAVSFVMFGIRVRADQLALAQVQLLAPLMDMVFFALFFGAAVQYRRKPDLHKRFMIVATTSLLIAAVGRMAFLGAPPNVWLLRGVWMSPILAAMAYDLVKHRTVVHWIYPLGIVVLVAQATWRRGARESETWGDISAWLATFFV